VKRSNLKEMELGSVLTVTEVAEILRMNSTTIYRLVKNGSIPGVKIGGNWRISKASLDLWLSAKGLSPHRERSEQK